MLMAEFITPDGHRRLAMKTRLRRLCVILISAVLIASAAWSDCYVTILHFNDFHGYLQPVERDGNSVGGLARIASAAREVRSWNDAHGNMTLLLEAGDVLQGTPFSMAYKGTPDFLCLNKMGVDAMCVGNHEFDFGQENLRRVMALAHFRSCRPIYAMPRPARGSPSR